MTFAGEIAGAIVTLLVAVFPFAIRSKFIQSFKDRSTLVAEKFAALQRALLAESTVREMRALIGALQGSVRTLEGRVTDMKYDVDKLYGVQRLALRYIRVLDGHNIELRALVAKFAPPDTIIPPKPIVPAKLEAAMAELDLEDDD